MTLDEIVSADLTALAADSRRRLRSVDDSLRTLHAATRPVHVAVPPALLPLAAGFTARVARAAGGAAALACALVLLAVLHDSRIDHPGPQPWWAWMVDSNTAAITAMIAVKILAARGLAGAVAARWVEARVRRAAASPAALAELCARLARGGDALAIGLSIAGTTCVVLVIGVMTWTLGSERWALFFYDRPEAGALFVDRLRDLTIAAPCIAAAAAVVGLACARGARWPLALAHRSVALVAASVTILAVHAAIICDLRPFSWHERFLGSASGARTVLTIAVALAVFVLAADRAVRRRAVRYSAEALAVPPDDAALVPIAGAFRARAARGIGGALAALCAIGLLVALHNPRHAILAHHLWTTDSNWKSFLFQDRFTIVALMIAAVLAARQVAAALADRIFRRYTRRDADRPLDLAVARRLVQRLDVPAVALGVAGVSALVLQLGVLDLTLGDHFWIFFDHHGARVDGLLRHTLRELVAATAVCFGAALAVAAACACAKDRSGWRAALAHWAVLPAGLALAAGAAATWLCLDFGVEDVSAALADQPSVALQNVLVIAATLGVLLITAGIAVRRRRGEQERAGLSLDA